MRLPEMEILRGALGLATGLALLGAPALAATPQEQGRTEQQSDRAQAAEDEADDAAPLAEGLVVIRDPESGEVRQASPHEMRELRQQLKLDRRRGKKVEELEAVVHDNGMSSIVLSDSFLVYTIVERAADGSFRIVKHGNGPELPELPNNQPPER